MYVITITLAIQYVVTFVCMTPGSRKGKPKSKKNNRKIKIKKHTHLPTNNSTNKENQKE